MLSNIQTRLERTVKISQKIYGFQKMHRKNKPITIPSHHHHHQVLEFLIAPHSLVVEES